MRKVLVQSVLCYAATFGLTFNAVAAELQDGNEGHSLALEEVWHVNRLIVADGEQYRVKLNVLVKTPEQTNIAFKQLSPPGSVRLQLDESGFVSDIQIIEYE